MKQFVSAGDESQVLDAALRPAHEPAQRRLRRLRRLLRFALNTLRNACTAVVILYLAVTSVYDRTRMVSNSMGPTLEGEEDAGDWVLVRRGAYRHREPERGDLISFRSFDGIPVIKRVVGLPGEMIQIRDGQVVVDDRPIVDPPVFREIAYDNCGLFRSPAHRFLVRPGWYFVLGDNTGDSYDSRFFGAIQRRQILGRVDFVYWPPKRIGRVR